LGTLDVEQFASAHLDEAIAACVVTLAVAVVAWQSCRVAPLLTVKV
jgi:hypothetical protein